MGRWGRRMGMGGLGLLIAVQLVAGVGVVAIRSQDAATTFTEDAALAEFRAQASGAEAPAPVDAPAGTAPTTAPSAAATPVTAAAPPSTAAARGATATGAPPAQPRAATPTSAAPAKPGVAPTPASPTSAPRQQVEPGVYTYATKGHEETDALGGARHDYPAQTTITVVAKECGRSSTWRPLAERVDERLQCPGPKGGEVRRFFSAHEFFGQKDNRTLTCPTGSISFPDDATPGTRFSFRCTDPRTDARTEGTVVGTEPVEVGGQVVEARRLRLETNATGDSTARSEIDLWLRATDGLLLRQVAKLDGRTTGPGGPIRYAERYELVLRSLTPAR